MRLGTARTLASTYFVLMLVFVTWPGLVPFSRVEPLILGLPFSMAWIAAWIAGSVVVLYLLDRVEGRYRAAGDPRADPAVGPLGLDESAGGAVGGAASGAGTVGGASDAEARDAHTPPSQPGRTS